MALTLELPQTSRPQFSHVTPRHVVAPRLAARNLLYQPPDLVEVGDKIVNIAPVKATLFTSALEYGIGTPNRQAPDGGHRSVIKIGASACPGDSDRCFARAACASRAA